MIPELDNDVLYDMPDRGQYGRLIDLLFKNAIPQKVDRTLMLRTCRSSEKET